MKRDESLTEAAAAAAIAEAWAKEAQVAAHAAAEPAVVPAPYCHKKALHLSQCHASGSNRRPKTPLVTTLSQPCLSEGKLTGASFRDRNR